MSHRTFVAVHRRDDRYDCYELPDRWPASRRAAPDRARGAGSAVDDDGPTPRPLEPDVEPTTLDVPLRTALARFVDPVVHEALVVVGPERSAREYAIVPYLLATAEGLYADEPAGAAVALDGVGGSWLSTAYLRGWYHGVTETLGEAVDRGQITPAEAIGWLEDAVHRLAGDRHEVITLPPTG